MGIGELASRCGVSRDAIRFYEREGVLPAPRRSASRYRVYGEEDVRRLRFVRRAQNIGFTLEDVRELLGAERLRSAADCRRVASLLRTRIADVDRRLSELGAFRRRLMDSLRRCEAAGGSGCPVVVDLAGAEPEGRRDPSR